MLPVRRAEVAEAAKLVENVYRAVNIALVERRLKYIKAGVRVQALGFRL